MTSDQPPLHRLKLSPSMVGVAFRRAPLAHRFKDGLCRRLAQNGINLTFLSACQTDAQEDLFCCLADADWHQARPLIEEAAPSAEPPCRIHPSVSLLSVFPHRSDSGLVTCLLNQLWSAGIVVHAAASSIAALTLVVDTERITPHAADLETRLGIHPEAFRKG